MDDQVDRLVKKALDLHETFDSSRRLLIGIAGIPGSGKTTFASKLTARINALYHANYKARHPNSPGGPPIVPNICTYVPLDGFHLTRAELDALPNAEEAHFRRGAAFTFDGEKFLRLVRTLRRPILPETRAIYVPSFDHAKKDPVENDIAIPRSAKIVVIEGNYLCLNRPPWSEAAELMDELWFVEVSIPTATERVVKRHVKAGISPNEEHARHRVDESDMRNGREIIENRLPVQEIIQSLEDDAWKPETVDDAQKLEEGKHNIDEEQVKAWHQRVSKQDEEARKLDFDQRPEMGRVGTSAGSVGSLAELARAGGGC